MKKKIGLLMGLSALALFGFASETQAADMQRLYNPNSGEHFYTASTTERNNLAQIGWQYEGVGWVAPENGDPVYRMYNPNSGDHHYTLSRSEKDNLTKIGWQYEGVGWYSDNNKTVPLYRAFNPNVQIGSHNYTTGESEQKNLISLGWQDEGLAWYGVAKGYDITSGNLSNEELAILNYSGTQTISINSNRPTFSYSDLSTANGAWERYGDLDNLNRATSAEALLNQSLMPTGERGDISSVTPTGFKNKKINSGYLYNRSHLIGWALSGENANWKNLITGTQQLNNPEMLRFEMDIKYYLEQSADNYVRYSVTPIFRGNELVARGVHLQAQSINSNAISFNKYIFNVQNDVTINYADGTSVVGTSETPANETPAPTPEPTPNPTPEPTPPTTTNPNDVPYVDANGRGLIKGSRSNIYHVPGSEYYDRTTNVKQWFKTINEAIAAGYRAPN